MFRNRFQDFHQLHVKNKLTGYQGWSWPTCPDLWNFELNASHRYVEGGMGEEEGSVQIGRCRIILSGQSSAIAGHYINFIGRMDLSICHNN